MVVFTSPGWCWFWTHYKITERSRKIKAEFVKCQLSNVKSQRRPRSFTVAPYVI